jgi:alkylation response protein AidB-like acyl-CoA dehydrogenase
MNFDPTPEQAEFCTTIRDFAERELNEHMSERDRTHEFSRALWQRCADIGLTGLTIDQQWEGQSADAITAALALEALGYGCRDNGLIFSINAHLWSAATPIARFGTDEQKERWLRGLCNGSLIGVQGMTEPESGSDAFALETTATRDGDGWILQGNKTYITNAPVADIFVIFASTDGRRGWSGLTAFVVERSTDGLTIGPPFHKMGLHTSPMSELHLDGCRIPADQVLGKVGNGMSIFNHSMDWERSMILAPAVGTMQRQVEESVAYARARNQFGQPIAQFQAVSHRIVDMAVRTRAARMLLYEMAAMKQQDRPTAIESSMVKLFVSEAWTQSSLDHVKNHGALGYMSDGGVERDLRDAVGSLTYSGTSDIQRNLIAGQLGL